MTNKKRAEFILWMGSIIEDFLSSQDGVYNYTQWTPRRKCCKENQNFGVFLSANDALGIVQIGQRDDAEIDHTIATFDFMGFTRRQVQSLCRHVVEATVTRWDNTSEEYSKEIEEIYAMVQHIKTPSSDIVLQYDRRQTTISICQIFNTGSLPILCLDIHNWNFADVKSLLHHAFQYLRY